MLKHRLNDSCESSKLPIEIKQFKIQKKNKQLNTEFFLQRKRRENLYYHIKRAIENYTTSQQSRREGEKVKEVTEYKEKFNNLNQKLDKIDMTEPSFKTIVFASLKKHVYELQMPEMCNETVSTFSHKRTSSSTQNINEIVSLSVANSFTIMVQASGKVWIKGDFQSEQNGQIHKLNEEDMQPTLLSNLPKIQMVQTGKLGQVFVYGKDTSNSGLLGIPGINCLSSPQLIQGLAAQKVISISSSEKHCLALTDQGRVYSWGANENGQLVQKQQKSKFDIPQLIELVKIFSCESIVCSTTSSVFLTKGGKVYVAGKSQKQKDNKRSFVNKLDSQNNDNSKNNTTDCVFIPSNLSSDSFFSSASEQSEVIYLLSESNYQQQINVINLKNMQVKTLNLKQQVDQIRVTRYSLIAISSVQNTIIEYQLNKIQSFFNNNQLSSSIENAIYPLNEQISYCSFISPHQSHKVAISYNIDRLKKRNRSNSPNNSKLFEEFSPQKYPKTYNFADSPLSIDNQVKQRQNKLLNSLKKSINASSFQSKYVNNYCFGDNFQSRSASKENSLSLSPFDKSHIFFKQGNNSIIQIASSPNSPFRLSRFPSSKPQSLDNSYRQQQQGGGSGQSNSPLQILKNKLINENEGEFKQVAHKQEIFQQRNQNINQKTQKKKEGQIPNINNSSLGNLKKEGSHSIGRDRKKQNNNEIENINDRISDESSPQTSPSKNQKTMENKNFWNEWKQVGKKNEKDKKDLNYFMNLISSSGSKQCTDNDSTIIQPKSKLGNNERNEQIKNIGSKISEISSAFQSFNQVKISGSQDKETKQKLYERLEFNNKDKSKQQYPKLESSINISSLNPLANEQSSNIFKAQPSQSQQNSSLKRISKLNSDDNLSNNKFLTKLAAQNNSNRLLAWSNHNAPQETINEIWDNSSITKSNYFGNSLQSKQSKDKNKYILPSQNNQQLKLNIDNQIQIYSQVRSSKQNSTEKYNNNSFLSSSIQAPFNSNKRDNMVKTSLVENDFIGKSNFEVKRLENLCLKIDSSAYRKKNEEQRSNNNMNFDKAPSQKLFYKSTQREWVNSFNNLQRDSLNQPMNSSTLISRTNNFNQIDDQSHSQIDFNHNNSNYFSNNISNNITHHVNLSQDISAQNRLPQSSEGKKKFSFLPKDKPSSEEKRNLHFLDEKYFQPARERSTYLTEITKTIKELSPASSKNVSASNSKILSKVEAIKKQISHFTPTISRQNSNDFLKINQKYLIDKQNTQNNLINHPYQDYQSLQFEIIDRDNNKFKRQREDEELAKKQRNLKKYLESKRTSSQQFEQQQQLLLFEQVRQVQSDQVQEQQQQQSLLEQEQQQLQQEQQENEIEQRINPNFIESLPQLKEEQQQLSTFEETNLFRQQELRKRQMNSKPFELLINLINNRKAFALNKIKLCSQRSLKYYERIITSIEQIQRVKDNRLKKQFFKKIGQLSSQIRSLSQRKQRMRNFAQFLYNKIIISYLHPAFILMKEKFLRNQHLQKQDNSLISTEEKQDEIPKEVSNISLQNIEKSNSQEPNNDNNKIKILVGSDDKQKPISLIDSNKKCEFEKKNKLGKIDEKNEQSNDLVITTQDCKSVIDEKLNLNQTQETQAQQQLESQSQYQYQNQQMQQIEQGDQKNHIKKQQNQSSFQIDLEKDKTLNENQLEQQLETNEQNVLENQIINIPIQEISEYQYQQQQSQLLLTNPTEQQTVNQFISSSKILTKEENENVIQQDNNQQQQFQSEMKQQDKLDSVQDQIIPIPNQVIFRGIIEEKFNSSQSNKIQYENQEEQESNEQDQQDQRKENYISKEIEDNIFNSESNKDNTPRKIIEEQNIINSNHENNSNQKEENEDIKKELEESQILFTQAIQNESPRIKQARDQRKSLGWSLSEIGSIDNKDKFDFYKNKEIKFEGDEEKEDNEEEMVTVDNLTKNMNEISPEKLTAQKQQAENQSESVKVEQQIKEKDQEINELSQLKSDKSEFFEEEKSQEFLISPSSSQIELQKNPQTQIQDVLPKQIFSQIDDSQAEKLMEFQDKPNSTLIDSSQHKQEEQFINEQNQDLNEIGDQESSKPSQSKFLLSPKQKNNIEIEDYPKDQTISDEQIKRVKVHKQTISDKYLSQEINQNEQQQSSKQQLKMEIQQPQVDEDQQKDQNKIEQNQEIKTKENFEDIPSNSNKQVSSIYLQQISDNQIQGLSINPSQQLPIDSSEEQCESITKEQNPNQINSKEILEADIKIEIGQIKEKINQDSKDTDTKEVIYPEIEPDRFSQMYQQRPNQQEIIKQVALDSRSQNSIPLFITKNEVGQQYLKQNEGEKQEKKEQNIITETAQLPLKISQNLNQDSSQTIIQYEINKQQQFNSIKSNPNYEIQNQQINPQSHEETSQKEIQLSSPTDKLNLPYQEITTDTPLSQKVEPQYENIHELSPSETNQESLEKIMEQVSKSQQQLKQEENLSNQNKTVEISQSDQKKLDPLDQIKIEEKQSEYQLKDSQIINQQAQEQIISQKIEPHPQNFEQYCKNLQSQKTEVKEKQKDNDKERFIEPKLFLQQIIVPEQYPQKQTKQEFERIIDEKKSIKQIQQEQQQEQKFKQILSSNINEQLKENLSDAIQASPAQIVNDLISNQNDQIQQNLVMLTDINQELKSNSSFHHLCKDMTNLQQQQQESQNINQQQKEPKEMFLQVKEQDKSVEEQKQQIQIIDMKPQLQEIFRGAVQAPPQVINDLLSNQNDQILENEEHQPDINEEFQSNFILDLSSREDKKELLKVNEYENQEEQVLPEKVEEVQQEYGHVEGEKQKNQINNDQQEDQVQIESITPQSDIKQTQQEDIISFSQNQQQNQEFKKFPIEETSQPLDKEFKQQFNEISTKSDLISQIKELDEKKSIEDQSIKTKKSQKIKQTMEEEKISKEAKEETTKKKIIEQLSPNDDKNEDLLTDQFNNKQLFSHQQQVKQSDVSDSINDQSSQILLRKEYDPKIQQLPDQIVVEEHKSCSEQKQEDEIMLKNQELINENNNLNKNKQSNTQIQENLNSFGQQNDFFKEIQNVERDFINYQSNLEKNLINQENQLTEKQSIRQVIQIENQFINSSNLKEEKQIQNVPNPLLILEVLKAEHSQINSSEIQQVQNQMQNENENETPFNHQNMKRENNNNQQSSNNNNSSKQIEIRFIEQSLHQTHQLPLSQNQIIQSPLSLEQETSYQSNSTKQNSLLTQNTGTNEQPWNSFSQQSNFFIQQLKDHISSSQNPNYSELQQNQNIKQSNEQNNQQEIANQFIENPNIQTQKLESSSIKQENTEIILLDYNQPIYSIENQSKEDYFEFTINQQKNNEVQKKDVSDSNNLDQQNKKSNEKDIKYQLVQDVHYQSSNDQDESVKEDQFETEQRNINQTEKDKQNQSFENVNQKAQYLDYAFKETRIQLKAKEEENDEQSYEVKEILIEQSQSFNQVSLSQEQDKNRSKEELQIILLSKQQEIHYSDSPQLQTLQEFSKNDQQEEVSGKINIPFYGFRDKQAIYSNQESSPFIQITENKQSNLIQSQLNNPLAPNQKNCNQDKEDIHQKEISDCQPPLSSEGNYLISQSQYYSSNQGYDETIKQKINQDEGSQEKNIQAEQNSNLSEYKQIRNNDCEKESHLLPKLESQLTQKQQDQSDSNKKQSFSHSFSSFQNKIEEDIPQCEQEQVQKIQTFYLPFQDEPQISQSPHSISNVPIQPPLIPNVQGFSANQLNILINLPTPNQTFGSNNQLDLIQNKNIGILLQENKEKPKENKEIDQVVPDSSHSKVVIEEQKQLFQQNIRDNNSEFQNILSQFQQTYEKVSEAQERTQSNQEDYQNSQQLAFQSIQQLNPSNYLSSQIQEDYQTHNSQHPELDEFESDKKQENQGQKQSQLKLDSPSLSQNDSPILPQSQLTMNFQSILNQQQIQNEQQTEIQYPKIISFQSSPHHSESILLQQNQQQQQQQDTSFDKIIETHSSASTSNANKFTPYSSQDVSPLCFGQNITVPVQKQTPTFKVQQSNFFPNQQDKEGQILEKSNISCKQTQNESVQIPSNSNNNHNTNLNENIQLQIDQQLPLTSVNEITNNQKFLNSISQQSKLKDPQESQQPQRQQKNEQKNTNPQIVLKKSLVKNPNIQSASLQKAGEIEKKEEDVQISPLNASFQEKKKKKRRQQIKFEAYLVQQKKSEKEQQESQNSIIQTNVNEKQVKQPTLINSKFQRQKSAQKQATQLDKDNYEKQKISNQSEIQNKNSKFEKNEKQEKYDDIKVKQQLINTQSKEANETIKVQRNQLQGQSKHQDTKIVQPLKPQQQNTNSTIKVNEKQQKFSIGLRGRDINKSKKNVLKEQEGENKNSTLLKEQKGQLFLSPLQSTGTQKHQLLEQKSSNHPQISSLSLQNQKQQKNNQVIQSNKQQTQKKFSQSEKNNEFIQQGSNSDIFNQYQRQTDKVNQSLQEEVRFNMHQQFDQSIDNLYERNTQSKNSSIDAQQGSISSKGSSPKNISTIKKNKNEILIDSSFKIMPVEEEENKNSYQSLINIVENSNQHQSSKIFSVDRKSLLTKNEDNSMKEKIEQKQLQEQENQSNCQFKPILPSFQFQNIPLLPLLTSEQIIQSNLALLRSPLNEKVPTSSRNLPPSVKLVENTINMQHQQSAIQQSLQMRSLSPPLRQSSSLYHSPIKQSIQTSRVSSPSLIFSRTLVSPIRKNYVHLSSSQIQESPSRQAFQLIQNPQVRCSPQSRRTQCFSSQPAIPTGYLNFQISPHTSPQRQPFDILNSSIHSIHLNCTLPSASQKAMSQSIIIPQQTLSNPSLQKQKVIQTTTIITTTNSAIKPQIIGSHIHPQPVLIQTQYLTNNENRKLSPISVNILPSQYPKQTHQ